MVTQVVWEDFLKIIKQEAGIQVVDTWFKAVSLKEWDSVKKNVVLEVPNIFVKNWLQEHYQDLIIKSLSRLLSVESLDILFFCKSEFGENKNFIPASKFKGVSGGEENKVQSTELVRLDSFNASGALVAKKIHKKKRSKENLNSSYTFDSFVVGPSNSLAHAAAYAVCQKLGRVYNPLFIYGITGLGKTHLLHAIGNEAKKTNGDISVRYVTADNFMHEFVSSIRFDKSNQFKEKFQSIDLLLLDDIQFFSNKEQTQETFFHIFNALQQKRKQVVFSSDTFPKEIAGLQNRLKSRMEGGLVVDIQTPDLETKIAIIKKKAELQSVKIDDEVAEFIASRNVSNIRSLEGALTRVGAFSALTNQIVTMDIAKKVLINIPGKKSEDSTIENIVQLVSKNYGITIKDLRSKKRQKDIAFARQIAFYLMKKHSVASLQTMGGYLGGRDHSTVIHAVSKVEDWMQKDDSIKRKIKDIEQEISSC